MTPQQKRAVATFAKGILTYVEDGNVIELHDCGFIQELKDAIAELNEDENDNPDS